MEGLTGNFELGNVIWIGLYFLPLLAGFVRKIADRNRQIPLGIVFLVDLLLGWTIIGWIVAMYLACREDEISFNESASIPSSNLPPNLTIWGPEQTPAREPESSWVNEPAQTFAPAWQMPESPQPCHCCQDKGQVCPSCFGSRGRWDLPTTENGSAQWLPCGYCCSSGRVQCSVCGKTGNGH